MIKLLKILQPHKKLLVTAVFLTALQALGTLYLPTLNAEIIDKGVVTGNFDNIIKFGVLMLIVALLTGIITIINSYYSSQITSKFTGKIRERILKKTQELSIKNVQQIGVASLITRSTSDVEYIGQTTGMFLQMLLPAPFMAIAGLVLAFTKNSTLALIIVGTIIIFLLFTLFFGKRIIPLYRLVQKKMENITRLVRENISGVRVIRAFNRETYEKERINAAAEDYATNSIKINKLFAAFQPGVLLIINFTIICIIWISGSNYVQIGDIMAMIEYCFIILYALIMALMTFLYIPRAQVCAERINAILDTTSDIQDSTDSSLEECIHGTVEFKNVTFGYNHSEKPILEKINFRSQPGEVTAVIGSTGSGKSTVAKLLLRFFDVQTGEILVNGRNIKDMTQEHLRNKIGYVPQKAVLFSGTIADNIRYGKKDATEKEIIHALDIAQSKDFVTNLEKGINSPVSQGGSNFSGGQKQRLSIARALVKKPEVYIFDDSFSALDFKTDSKLRTALKPEIINSTVILVAQRISTIVDADRILVLDEGNLVGIGTHEELMKTSKVYKQIAHSQLSESELEKA